MIPLCKGPELQPSPRFRRARLRRIVLTAGLACALWSLAEGSGAAQSACGGSGERACCTTERSFFAPSCDSGLVEIVGSCSGNCVCGGFNPLNLSSVGMCRQIDGDGFPSHCGGVGESACKVFEHVPSCKASLTEVPLPGGTCIALDAEGFPPFCGGENERPCTAAPLEHIPSCKSGLAEVPFPGGNCIRLDEDGFPPSCGDENERPCTAAPLEHIPSCKAGFAEFPLLFGRCQRLDADGFPPYCGDEYELTCGLVDHITACKPGLVMEGSQPGPDGMFPFRNECRSSCGKDGQRSCTILESFSACKTGLSLRSDEFDVCGRDAVNWAETDANEVPRGGPRTVFFFHGRSGDYEGGPDPVVGDFLHGLGAGAKNVKQIYGVDWNNKGAPPRKLMTWRFLDAECRPDDCDRTWGTEEFDQRDFEITEIARATADAIMHLPTEGEITIVGGSFGAVIARQLVYRHYDEIRQFGKRIAEVITMAGPNRGGTAGALEIGGPGLLGSVEGFGAFHQTAFSCLPFPQGVDPVRGIPQADRVGCQLGQWIDWMKSREDGTNGPSWFIDNRSYPQIRWITMTANGDRLAVEGTLESARTLEPVSFLYVDLLESLIDPEVVPFHDSDQTITVRSALGLSVDECYPFSRERSPSGGGIAESVPVRRFYQKTVNGQTVIQEALSAVCFHANARHDPRVLENAPAPDYDDGFPHELTGAGHGDLFTNATATDFVVAALNLFGDTNGDGVVNASDSSADAGADRSLECSAALTRVTLDASKSNLPGGGSPSYTWSGPFGTATGATPTVDLPPGTHQITLTIEDGGLQLIDHLVVTISDTTSPQFGGTVDYTVEATAAGGTPFTLVAPASDVCSAVTVEFSPAVTVYPVGNTTVTVTATDESGNSASGTVIIAVVDTTPPVVTAPANVNAEAIAVLSPLAIGQASATDIFGVTLTSDAQAAFPLGSTVVTWTATDANGNAATATHTITVVDTTPPLLTPPPNVVVVAAGSSTQVAIGVATVSDIFGATVSHDAPASFPVGATLVTWTAVDGNGHRASATQRIEVVYTFDGFRGPFEPGGTYRVNRTLPVMFTLSFAGGTPATAATATIGVVRIGNDGAAADPLDIGSDGVADGGHVFRFTGNHYQFNLTTRGWNPGVYRVMITLDDGRSYSMDIGLR